MNVKYWVYKQKISLSLRLQKMMKCICSGEQLRIEDIIPSSESLATRDYSASGYSSRAGDDAKADTSNIEEAESSLRESGILNYEEARALLGRLEYQKGNIEAALHVFEGIDIAAVVPKLKLSIARRGELPRRNSLSDATPPMSMHAVSLLFEAILLKATSLQALGRFTEAAQSCTVILDTVESALPDGLPENFSTDCKLLETLNKAVELLPELWKLACAPQEAILSYRRALLYCWNLDVETRSKIEKEYAVFLLYSGTDAAPPNLRAQAEGSFIPRNNIEEAILLLLVLLRRYILSKIVWDPSILDHLSFALSIAGEFRALARQVEELLPGIVVRREKYTILSLCYYAEGDDISALNLLRNLMNNRDNKNGIFELVLAAKICAEYPNLLEEGMGYARKVVPKIEGRCNQMASVAKCLLGLLLSGRSRAIVSDSERTSVLCEALESLDSAHKMTGGRNPSVLFYLSLENAEQRKLDIALYYAKQLLKLVVGVLRKLCYEEKLAFRFFTWAGHRENYSHEPQAYNEMIDILSSTKYKVKQFRIVCDLLDYMKRNDKSLVPLEVLLKILRKYTEKHLTYLHKFAKKKKIRVKTQPEVYAFNLLLDALCKCCLVEEAEALFNRVKSKVKPTADTYNILFFGWCRVRNPDRAMSILEQMINIGHTPDNFTYNTAIETFCTAGMVMKAAELLEFMRTKGSTMSSPTAKTYSIMIVALVQNDMMEECFKVLGDMLSSGCVPDVSTYKELIEGMCLAGKTEAAYKILEEMGNKGYPADIVTYNCFLKVLCDNKESDEALRLYKKMMEVGCVPSVQTYNMLIVMFFRMGDVDGAFETWHEMSKRGCARVTETYCVMIEGLFDNNATEEACFLLEEAVNKGMKLPYRKFDSFLMRLSAIGDLRAIHKLSEHMRTFYNPAMARRFAINQRRKSMSLRSK